MSNILGTFTQPGFSANFESQESNIWWGPPELRLIGNAAGIAAATVDSNNTPTTLLRPGLVLGIITSTGLYTQYSPTATDGSQTAVAILLRGERMTDINGTTEIKFQAVALGGPVKAASLIGLDAIARQQLSNHFIFDDDINNKARFGGPMRQEVSKAADYTVTAADAGTLFTAITGAVNFTLPALAAGLGPFEFLNLVDANMTVTSAAGDDIVWDQDLAADSLAFSTASHKIGGRLQFRCNAAGTKWYVRNFSPATCTVTAVS